MAKLLRFLIQRFAVPVHIDLLERVHDSIVLAKEENVNGGKRWMLIDL